MEATLGQQVEEASSNASALKVRTSSSLNVLLKMQR